MNLDATELGFVTGWENWVFTSNVGTILTLAADNVAAGATLTIDTTAVTARSTTRPGPG